MILLSAREPTSLHSELAKAFGASIGTVESRSFPDGELYLRIMDDLKGQDVLVVQNTRTEHDFLSLLMLLEAARALEPARLDLLVPYFGYARQHMRYNIGEPISSKVIVDAISPYVDAMFCVDIHDEETLEYSSKPFNNIHITQSILNHYKNSDISYVISPDDGGYERVKTVANLLGAFPLHLDKKRESDSVVKVVMNEVADIYGKNVLLLDDVISTGGTILQSLDLLKRRKVSSLYVCAVHGIFANKSDETIAFSCSGLSVSNTINTKYSTIDISEEVAKKIKEVIK